MSLGGKSLLHLRRGNPGFCAAFWSDCCDWILVLLAGLHMVDVIHPSWYSRCLAVRPNFCALNNNNGERVHFIED